jgi:hypothetical protein
MQRHLRTGAIAGCLIAAFAATPAQAQGDFYKGKTVTVVVGARLTGSLSIAAQLVAQHMGTPADASPS